MVKLSILFFSFVLLMIGSLSQVDAGIDKVCDENKHCKIHERCVIPKGRKFGVCKSIIG